MKKNSKLHIPISTEGKEKLKKRAEACEMTLTAYCLYILMNTTPIPQKKRIPI